MVWFLQRWNVRVLVGPMCKCSGHNVRVIGNGRVEICEYGDVRVRWCASGPVIMCEWTWNVRVGRCASDWLCACRNVRVNMECSSTVMCKWSSHNVRVRWCASDWLCASRNVRVRVGYSDVRVIGYVRMVQSQCASEHEMCEWLVMCESKCASGSVIMCESGDVRVVRS